jgi:hypothetical protein
VRAIQDARKQLDAEKKCMDLARREQLYAAVAAADQGIAEYPNATLVRYCKMNVLVRRQAPPTPSSAMANEILAIDPNSSARWPSRPMRSRKRATWTRRTTASFACSPPTRRTPRSPRASSTRWPPAASTTSPRRSSPRPSRTTRVTSA